MKKRHVAYDYARQAWVMDPATARELRRSQVAETLRILHSPTGASYAAFVGDDLDTMTKRLEAELLTLCQNQ